MKSDAARRRCGSSLRKYKFEDIEIRQDLAGLDRVVLGRKKLQEDKYV